MLPQGHVQDVHPIAQAFVVQHANMYVTMYQWGKVVFSHHYATKKLLDKN